MAKLNKRRCPRGFEFYEQIVFDGETTDAEKIEHNFRFATLADPDTSNFRSVQGAYINGSYTAEGYTVFRKIGSDKIPIGILISSNS